MKMISILAAGLLLAGSATASFAQSSYPMTNARDMGDSKGYAESQLTTGRSVAESGAYLDNCQKGEPSISPNGNAPLNDMAVCR